jgi:hypothetical protein
VVQWRPPPHNLRCDLHIPSFCLYIFTIKIHVPVLDGKCVIMFEFHCVNRHASILRIVLLLRINVHYHVLNK